MGDLWPKSIGSNLYLLQLLGVSLSLVMVAFGAWRIGVAGIGLTFALGVLARLAIKSPNEGMLRVRGKFFDVLWTAALAFALIVLALTVPSYR